MVSRSLLVVVLALLVSPSVADDDASPDGVQRFAMNPFHANVGRIARVEKDGLVELVDVSNPRFALGTLANLPDLAEGWYLGFVGAEFTVSTEDTRLVRIRVVSVGEKGTASIRVSPRAAERIEKGEQVVLFRPPGATTKQVESCPDFVKVDDGRETTVLGRSSVNTAARLTRSRNNLKQILLAMHNFHDTHNAFPPAVIRGPDGKPWHSWRVLLLPYLEQSNLYERYRWDEPWNGPNNKKLLAEMPAVYADPIHDGPNNGHYTHYAVATGPSAGFSTQGIAMNAANPTSPLANLRGPGTTRIRDFTDGTSNTVIVGSIAPDAKIPWMKPEDVVFEKEYPRPGEKGSFAAPYESRNGRGGVFGRCDGSVFTIRTDVDPDDWRGLITRNGAEVVDQDEVPGLQSSPSRRRGTRAMQFVEVYTEDNTLRAKLVAE